MTPCGTGFDGPNDEEAWCGQDGLLCQTCEIVNLKEINEELKEGLRIIAGGFAGKFKGAPDVMEMSPGDFRSAMWTWSQKVARAHLPLVENIDDQCNDRVG